MAIIVRQPTSNETPDSGQGGDAVTGAINTGHDVTVTSDPPTPGSATKSCRWFGFAAVPGEVLSAKLKLDWTEDGSIPDGSNSFRIQYSVNGGGAWTDIINHSDISAPDNNSEEVTLPLPLDITQVQVRDRMTAQAATLAATVLTSISNIQVEVTVSDVGRLIVMM